MSMSNELLTTVRDHKAGSVVGVYSVCSAHPTVLRASIRQAAADGTYVLIEATSNQVDQFGGYTGLTPPEFREQVLAIAASEGFPAERVVLGGDHLGPNRWRAQGPDAAMDLSEELVRAYVRAGYTKIHLDCSFPCAGDPTPLSDETVASRAVRLLGAAEDEARTNGIDPSSIAYVIGTEVPTPGGATETLDALTPTSPEAARRTLEVHRQAVADAGLQDAWDRIIALVVQPAVEFDHLRVVDYDPAGTVDLRAILDDEPTLVFEAHSTDYQEPAGLAALVEDHWAILKVGPGLTFGLREGLFALERIEQEIVPAAERSRLADVIDERMLAEPGYWEHYYEGDADEQRIARKFSYSDRLRYYWPDPAIVAAEAKLLDNLAATEIPLPLLSQYLPAQYERVRAGTLDPSPHELVIDKVRDVLRPYAAACSARATTNSGSILV
jgi:D-tagatose-1,6-bisphosphate aldolase subunit GatZ/KbaZ